MLIRNYTSADMDALRRILEKTKFEYAFPELNDWQFNPKLVVEDDAGEVVMGATLRMTSEAYLWVDPEAGSPRERWWNLQALHETLRQEANRLGYRDVHAFLPPGLPKAFRRRLKGLGWVPEPFEPWWRPTA